MATRQSGPTIDYTMFQASLLRAIERLNDPSGLDIKNHLDGVYPNQINNGRLYQNLNQLVNRDLVMKGDVDDRTNWYRLTDRGRREYGALVDWMEDAR